MPLLPVSPYRWITSPPTLSRRISSVEIVETKRSTLALFTAKAPPRLIVPRNWRDRQAVSTASLRRYCFRLNAGGRELNPTWENLYNDISFIFLLHESCFCVIFHSSVGL